MLIAFEWFCLKPLESQSVKTGKDYKIETENNGVYLLIISHIAC